jgi:hypothetical protein
MKPLAILRIFVLSYFFSIAYAQDVNPGVERWAVKTSLPAHPKKKKATIDKLLALPDPIVKEREAPDDGRITKAVDDLKEGNLVTTKAWLHLVALERDSKKHRDGDYHIQLRNSAEWGDSCFVVEIPDPKFIDDPLLKEKCAEAREFVRTRLLKNKEPGTGGNVMKHEVYVTVTGQLFFDASHLTGNLRGKKGKMKKPMHSYTCWELHPVTHMAFAQKPR